VFDVAARAIGVDKILFASDFPLVAQRRALDEFERSGLSAKDSLAVRGGNAVGLLKI
jgi:hypothetical protein